MSGPATGLEMMQPVGLTVPTPNFFARRAYYVNKMVIGKTSAELLAEFTRRMDASSRKAGAVEFAAAFDERGRTKSCPGARRAGRAVRCVPVNSPQAVQICTGLTDAVAQLECPEK